MLSSNKIFTGFFIPKCFIHIFLKKLLLLVFMQVVVCWLWVLGFLIYEFFHWTSLLSSWQGIIITMLFLLLVIVIMEIFIHSSESEHSKPKFLPTQDPLKQNLIQRWWQIRRMFLDIYHNSLSHTCIYYYYHLSFF